MIVANPIEVRWNASNRASQLITRQTPLTSTSGHSLRSMENKSFQPPLRQTHPVSAAAPNRQRKNTTLKVGWPVETEKSPAVPDSAIPTESMIVARVSSDLDFSSALIDDPLKLGGQWEINGDLRI
nr:hypothetical protein [Mesorhizobium sp.]